MNIDNIKASDVMSVYVGKAGACHCGCSGKYSYAKAYQAVVGKECKDDTVPRVFNRVMDSIASGSDVSISLSKEGGFISHLSVESDAQVYIVYLRPCVGR